MRRRSALLAILVLTATAAPAQTVDQLYQQNCALCHGEDLTGGMSGSLIDDKWTTDGSDRALYKAIAQGQPDLGMPAYDEAMTDPQIWSMVVYIREKAYNRQRQREGDARPVDGVYASQHHDYKLELLLERVPGVDRPWALDFLPDGRMIFTERSGMLFVCTDGVTNPVRIEGIPEAWEHGQGGLLDVAVHPDHADNGWVYLSYADKSQGRAGMTTVARGKIDFDNKRWIDNEVLFRAPEELDSGSGVHFGSRFVFDGKGHVFFSVGDRGQKQRAQQLDKPNGKIHRINEDGSIPEDNPFVGRDDAMPTIWSYGHRNPQGLAQHPTTAKLYDIEHAPRGGDEINLVRKGENYGWPVVSYTINYNGTPFGEHAPWHEPHGFVEPVHYWIPAIAQCGSNFYTGDKFPKWQNDLFVAALAKQEIHRVRLNEAGDDVVEDEVLLRGIGRVRDVVPGPDGNLYLAVEQPGRIYRMVPAQ